MSHTDSMLDDLYPLIRATDWAGLRRYCAHIDPQSLSELRSSFRNNAWKRYSDLSHGRHHEWLGLIHYTILCCCRTPSDLQLNFPDRPGWRQYWADCQFLNHGPLQPYLDFRESPEGCFLKDVSLEVAGNLFHLPTVWELWERGIVKFDTYGFLLSARHALTPEDIAAGITPELGFCASFFMEHPASIKRLLYEIPYQDTNKEVSLCGGYRIFGWLQEVGCFTDRTIITRFLEGLSHPFNTPTLQTFCRIVSALRPTVEEMVERQAELLSLLASPCPTVVKFVVDWVKRMKDHPDLDRRSFCDLLTAAFIHPRCVKSVITALKLIGEWMNKGLLSHPEYSEQLATLFLSTDRGLQIETAILLKQHFDRPAERLSELVEPYTSGIFGEALALLGLNSKREQPTEDLAEAYMIDDLIRPVSVPDTWDELLFKIGEAIGKGHPLDFALVYEGLNRFADQRPDDFDKQLKPYCRQLDSRSYVSSAHYRLGRLLTSWTGFKGQWILNKTVSDRKKHFLTQEGKLIRYRFEEAQDLIELLKSRERGARYLPLISTPTHTPFYIAPATLLQRLLAYEDAGQAVSSYDLLVGVCRLLPGDPDEETRRMASCLKGDYGDALRYYFGLSNKVESRGKQVYLWMNILRMMHPDGPTATGDKDIDALLPLLNVSPLAFSIDEERYGDVSWKTLRYEDIVLDKQEERLSSESVCFFDDYGRNPYFDHSAGGKSMSHLVSYMPRCLQNIVLGYLPEVSVYNEVLELESQRMLLEALLHYRVALRGAGLLFVAAALVGQQRETRDLASEYVAWLLAEKVPMHVFPMLVARLTGEGYAPCARLTEWITRLSPFGEVNSLKHAVVKACQEVFCRGKMPLGGKKLLALETELRNRLQGCDT